MEIIRFDNVDKAFSGKPVLKHLDFTLESGKTYCLLGESGSGKTTALRLMNGLLMPDSGSVKVFGKKLSEYDPVALRRRMGYAIQGSGLFPHMTILQNTSLVARRVGWSWEKCEERCRSLLAMVNLDVDLTINKFPRQLSGGQQQRIGLIRALFLKPKLLLMDEPFGALDPITREDVQDEFIRLQRELGFTAVVVTHDLHEAFKLSNAILLLNEGNLDQFGKPSQLMNSPATNYVAQLMNRFKKNLELNYE